MLVGAAAFPKSVLICCLPPCLSQTRSPDIMTPQQPEGEPWPGRRNLWSGWILSRSLLPRNAPPIVMDDHGRSIVGGLSGNAEKVDGLRPHPWTSGLPHTHEEPCKEDSSRQPLKDLAMGSPCSSHHDCQLGPDFSLPHAWDLSRDKGDHLPYLNTQCWSGC